ncbi:hypothetical protein KY332_03865 [Candidatus Woesearchaeota archaeon]|nr:hypothetical protein [Candidatus Woesearchaeota archaeon]
MKKIFSKIIDSIDEKILDKEISIDESRFIDVKKINEGRIAFVDGGQAELLKGSNFSLQFIRVGGLVFDGKDKKSIVNEFFVLISMDGDEYKTEVFVVKGDGVDNISINSFDGTIKEGKDRGNVSKVGGIVRRFAELELAGRVVRNVSAVVLDGSLKAMVKGEEEKLEKLFEKGIVCGLAKTSKIIEDGRCVLSRLNGREGEWCYGLGEREYVVRLNKNSDYVFEFNINRKDKMMDVLGMLAGQANDAVFPGYPYGLLMADKIARVSNEEKEYLLTLFKAHAGSKWNKIKNGLNVVNAHDVLDNI